MTPLWTPATMHNQAVRATPEPTGPSGGHRTEMQVIRHQRRFLNLRDRRCSCSGIVLADGRHVRTSGEPCNFCDTPESWGLEWFWKYPKEDT